MRIWTIYDLMEPNDDADACVVNGQLLKARYSCGVLQKRVSADRYSWCRRKLLITIFVRHFHLMG